MLDSSSVFFVIKGGSMHDLRMLRDNLSAFREQLGCRGGEVPWQELENLLAERAERIRYVEDLRHQLKKGSEAVAQFKRAKQPADEAIAAMKTLGDQIQAGEERRRQVEEALTQLVLRIPNLPHASVPAGLEASDNVEIRRWGEPTRFSFPPQTHVQLGETLGILDFERAGKVTGARFSVSFGAGAQLERALASFMLDLHGQAHGHTEVLPPYLVNRQTMTGTGQLPKFEEDAFHLEREDFFLIPTAEVPVTNLHREEILPIDQLPIRYVSHTPCFRREAGAYGKDTQGLIRVHQFNKVELVIFAEPERSYDELERITVSAESVLQQLELPYRVMMLCAGDMGFSAAKTYDLEVWVPSQNTYREVSSCSNFEAFQARRANIRYRRKDGKPDFLHTLNGSGLAIGRTLVALLENYQQEDGSVLIPPVLKPYLGGLERISPKQG